MRRWVKRGVVALTVVAFLAASGVVYYHYNYPYGWSHCCDKCLALDLLNYAEKHGGWFPRGEATPEASLSLLARDEEGMWAILRGKTVPESVVKERLEAGLLLTPETCGWHYVEGLRKDDDHRLALFWDKVGLGHNGERLSGGGHMVCFVDCHVEYIPGRQWQAFLAEQERLRAKLKR